MSSPRMDIAVEELAMPTDHLTHCSTCGVLITGTMYQDVFFVNKEIVHSEFWYCYFCYNE